MYQLTGEYECKLDAKGRVRLPSALIRQIGGTGALSMVVNRGFEKCLMLYPKDVWDKKVEKVNKLNIYNPKQRQFMRYFYRGATDLTSDSADRILLPKSLMEYANMSKGLMMFAYHEQIEIWSKEAYQKSLDEEPEDFSQLAAEVFGGINLADDELS
jgi:MraZ protein